MSALSVSSKATCISGTQAALANRHEYLSKPCHEAYYTVSSRTRGTMPGATLDSQHMAISPFFSSVEGSQGYSTCPFQLGSWVTLLGIEQAKLTALLVGDLPAMPGAIPHWCASNTWSASHIVTNSRTSGPASCEQTLFLWC